MRGVLLAMMSLLGWPRCRGMPIVCNREAPLDVKLFITALMIKHNLNENDDAALQKLKSGIILYFRSLTDEQRQVQCNDLMASMNNILS
jgi:hypothetical protein